MLNQFFNRLSKESILYCHWKSIDKMDRVYEGSTDIDLLIDVNSISKFNQILSEFNIINIKPRLWMTYPSMNDYLLIDDKNGRYYHLHLHYKLIMGKKNAKEIILPLENFYLQNSVKHDRYDTFIIDPNIDIITLLLRISIKYNLIKLF